MSKQTTLFSTWRVSAPTSGKNWNNSTSGQSNRNTAKVCPDENLKFEFQDFDEFFEDDLKEAEILESYANDPHGTRNLTTSTSHAQQVTARSFHVGPSTSILNSSITEESIPGFNSVAGEVWIYPTNYPVRDYQFNIVQKSLFTNTLVCLPTGLGKTFIAAVVMYNFYSWYPNGKIVFLAPTKPLVAQQIEACYGVMGIPQDHAAEMTGVVLSLSLAHAHMHTRTHTHIHIHTHSLTLSNPSLRTNDIVSFRFCILQATYLPENVS